MKEILKEEEGNILVSPLAAEIILGLAQSGAKDNTAEEIRNGLFLPSSNRKTKTAFKTFFSLLDASKPSILKTANKIYVKKNVQIKSQFKEVAEDIYRAKVENIDFSKEDDAVDEINYWVRWNTDELIDGVIDADTLNNQTSLLLINSLYFKGNWLYSFELTSSKKQPFYKTNGEVVQVETISVTQIKVGYYESSELKAKFLKLPFEGYEFFLIIVLPDEIEGLASIENYEQIFTPPKYRTEIMDITLPKFKLQKGINLKKILKNFGVTTAFSNNEANFSRISTGRNLKISEVAQKVHFGISESGSETVFTNIGLFALPPDTLESKEFI
ncbi:Serpin domain containing protein, partial [Asbolus verrucosus]